MRHNFHYNVTYMWQWSTKSELLVKEQWRKQRNSVFCSELGFLSYTHDTHSRNRRHKSTPFFWRRFLVRVSCISGTGFVWYQIPAPIRTVFYSKSETGIHVTEMVTFDELMMITAYVLMRSLT